MEAQPPEPDWEAMEEAIEHGDGASLQPTEPGWYRDPAGVYEHLAYWDGEGWTGATAPGPNHPGADFPPGPPVPVYPYRSARVRARWAQVLIGLVAALALFEISATWGEIQLLQRIQDGGFVSNSEAAASNNLVVAASVLVLFALIAAGVVYLLWIHRSVGNLGQVRSGHRSSPLRFTPGWAVGWYFVPLMNLVRPFQVMRELYEESSPERTGVALVGWWWAIYLGGGLIDSGAAVAFFSDQSLSELITSDYLTIAANVLTVVAAVLVILLIDRIVTWQESRAEQLGLI